MNPAKTVLSLALGALVAVAAHAQDPKPAPKQDPPSGEKSPSKDELKSRMAARYPRVAALRDSGKIGETSTGEVKLVKPEFGSEKVDAKDASKGTVAELVAAENKDRRLLYELIGKEEKLTPAEVGKQNGLRNFQKAKPDHWVEVDGKWVQRKTVKPVTEKPPAKQ